MSNILNTVARRYCYSFPLDIGKWRVAVWLERRSASRSDSVTVRVPAGFRMNLRLSDFVQRSIYLNGHWEPEIEREIYAHLKPGDLFADIGANVGYFSLLASKIVSPNGQVVAVEASPATYAALQENLNLNGSRNVRAACVAASDIEGTAPFFDGLGNNSGAAALHTSPSTTASAITVPTQRFDVILAGITSRKPALVKIDVEGNEVHVLRGMSEMLSGPDAPIVICEVSEFSLASSGSSRDELFSLMGAAGYKPRLLQPVRQSNFDSAACHLQFNVVFAK